MRGHAIPSTGAPPRRGASVFRLVAGAQGVYYVLTGLWPLLHPSSFLAVTGPKTDLWLVQTFGALILAAGAALLCATLRGLPTPEVRVLAVGAAIALILCEVWFVHRGAISRVYLLDAAAHALLVIGWGIEWRCAAPGASRGWPFT